LKLLQVSDDYTSLDLRFWKRGQQYKKIEAVEPRFTHMDRRSPDLIDRQGPRRSPTLFRDVSVNADHAWSVRDHDTRQPENGAAFRS